MIAKLLTLALALTLAAPAQEKPAETPKPRQTGVRYIQRLYQPKHLGAEELYRLVYTTPSGQGQTPVLNFSRALKAITAYGTTDEVTSIMENLKLLDVPDSAATAAPRGLELSLSILIAAPQGELPGSPVPSSLSAVTTELQRIFGLKEFRLLDGGVLRTSDGQSSTWGGNAGPDWRYSANFRARVTGNPGSATVLFDGFTFVLSNPRVGPIRFETGFNLKEGQQVVVGTANDGTNRSIILVLSARIPQ